MPYWARNWLINNNLSSNTDKWPKCGSILAKTTNLASIQDQISQYTVHNYSLSIIVKIAFELKDNW